MPRRIIPYDPGLKGLARRLRSAGTLGEVLLWGALKRRQRRGYSFYRQRPVDRYIVDFYCPELGLVIELDGASHDEERVDDDLRRQSRLEELGLQVIRFTEAEVRGELEAVIAAIDGWIDEHGSASEDSDSEPV